MKRTLRPRVPTRRWEPAPLHVPPPTPPARDNAEAPAPRERPSGAHVVVIDLD
ncbi:MAG: hypothetical protein K8W52_13040 [Deltaproteobacteria bacterium]|nr:hypothetical protein [Deltaproteobacteria bacterium]